MAVRPTTEMMNTIVQILVEVISILGIATKETNDGIISEQFTTSMPSVTKRCSEKYGKKLIGRSDLEDALKRLDELTHEEARMATAEVLRMTHAIDERVTRVDDKVGAVINGAQIILVKTENYLI